LLKDVVLEAMDIDVDRFTLLYWKTEIGSAVDTGDELVVVEAEEEKTALSVLAPCSGILVEVLAKEDQEVAIGDVLGRIESN
jgi:2-oxoglutarate dehydrogenase E2 component (dihydrolipoamide succinyltransferase)